MRAIRLYFFGVVVVLLVLAVTPFVKAQGVGSGEAPENKGFTAVAGTETTVTDKRTKNNTALVSGFIITFVVLAAIGAMRYEKTKPSAPTKN